MINKTKLFSATQFFVAWMFLFIGLLDFAEALSYDGLENNFLADNWGLPLVFLLTLIFSLGWGFESIVENLVLFKGRKVAIFSLVGILLIFIVLIFGSWVFTLHGFFQEAMRSIGYFLMSGFFFHFSVIRSEVLAKLQMRG